MTIDKIGGSGYRPDLQQASTDQASKASQAAQAGQVGAVQDKLVDAAAQQLMSQALLQQAVQTATSQIWGNSLPGHETNMPYYDQGSTNGCGTTSLAMVMSYLGIAMTQGDIDNAIRRMDVFTCPDRLIDFARDNGLAAEGYNNGSWAEMQSFIDKGIPTIALIDAGDSGNMADMHYVTVAGYRQDPVTGEKFVQLHNPWGPEHSEMPMDEFMARWDRTPLGYDNYFMAFAPGGTVLPPGRNDGIMGTNALAEGISQLTNGLNRMYNPDSVGGFFRGVFEFGGGIGETVGGFVGFGLNWCGSELNNLVEGIPVVENLVQPFGSLVSGIGEGIGCIANGFGDAVGHFGEGFEDLFSGDVGGFFTNVGEGIWDGIKGVGEGIWEGVKGVGNAIADFFSGW